MHIYTEPIKRRQGKVERGDEDGDWHMSDRRTDRRPRHQRRHLPDGNGHETEGAGIEETYGIR